MSKKIKGGIQMLDKQGRITIKEDLLANATYVKKNGKVDVYLEPDKKRLHLNPKRIADETYFVGSCKMDEKGRIYIPASIRKNFSNAHFLPAELKGEIYILIIE